MSSDTAKSSEERQYWQEKIQQSDGWWQEYREKVVDILSRHEIARRYLDDGGASLSGFHPSEPTAKYELHFDKDQRKFHGTAYHKEVKGKKFVHFTSFQACMEILGTGKIRLYNPNYGNDPNEVIFAAKEVFNTEFEAERAIQELFALSLCDETVLNDLTMWRLYGGNGSGVALILELQNEEEMWDDWYFGKVQYGETEELKALNAFHQDMRETFGENKEPRIILDLKPLYAFHKSGVFHTESESRLLFKNVMTGADHQHNDSSPHAMPGLKTGVSVSKVLTKDFRESYHCSYPLYWSGSDEEISQYFFYQHGPRIRLKGIELGFRYTDADAQKMSVWLTNQLWDKYSLDVPMRVNTPDITVSALKGAFR